MYYTDKIYSIDTSKKQHYVLKNCFVITKVFPTKLHAAQRHYILFLVFMCFPQMLILIP